MKSNRTRKPTSFEILKFDFSKYHHGLPKASSIHSSEESEEDESQEEAQPRKYKSMDRVMDAYITYLNQLQETEFLKGFYYGIERWVHDSFNTS